MDYTGLSAYDARVVSFLSERLTGIFITRLLREGRLEIRHVPGINIDTV